jgi:hypothetical protein
VDPIRGETLKLTDIGTVDEAKEVEERDGWNSPEIQLPPKSSFGCRIKLNGGIAITERSVWTDGINWSVVGLTCRWRHVHGQQHHE